MAFQVNNINKLNNGEFFKIVNFKYLYFMGITKPDTTIKCLVLIVNHALLH